MNKVIIRQTTKLSSVWLIPLFAIFVSTWFVVKHYVNSGTEIEIRFNHAEGVVANATQIKALSVDVGVVTKVDINEDLNSVTVFARIKPQASDLLRQDSQFWVVKPRIGSKGISGLNTLLSGAYIELEPGQDSPGKNQFIGLENPPLMRVNKGGLNLSLLTNEASSLNAGAAVLYQGQQVGQITNIDITKHNKIKINIYIEAPYTQIVNSQTRFYNASGLAFQVNSQGFAMHTQSLESLFTGGIAFESVPTLAPAKNVSDGAEFLLYSDKMAATEHPYQNYLDYLLLFNGSIRGLSIGEAVEYRGIKIGNVLDINFTYLKQSHFLAAEQPLVPVLIRLYPAYILNEDSQAAVDKLDTMLKKQMAVGLRAALKTGSLVTGQSLVQLDFYPDMVQLETPLVHTGKYPVMPTLNDDIDMMFSSITQVMQKLERLPIEGTLTQINQVIANLDNNLTGINALTLQINELTDNLNQVVGSDHARQLPADLSATLKQASLVLEQFSAESDTFKGVNKTVEGLNQALFSIQNLIESIEQEPDALLWGKTKPAEFIPGGE